MTQVPPTRNSSATMTRAPWLAAMRAARTPPEPAPITNKSTSCPAIAYASPDLSAGLSSGAAGSHRVAPLLQFIAHLRRHFGRELVGPVLGEVHAVVHDDRLLGEHLLACRRLIEGEDLLELLLGEVRRVLPRDFLSHLGEARLKVVAHLGGDLVEVLLQHRVLLQEEQFRLLDDARDQRTEQGHRA